MIQLTGMQRSALPTRARSLGNVHDLTPADGSAPILVDLRGTLMRSRPWYQPTVIGRESVGSASGPASPVLTGYGHRVGSLGPGLTSESADAVRAVLRDDLSAGPQVYRHLPAVPGLIRPAWTRGRGSRV